MIRLGWWWWWKLGTQGQEGEKQQKHSGCGGVV